MPRKRSASRKCLANRCSELVEPPAVFCRNHWDQLPEALRETIQRAILWGYTTKRSPWSPKAFAIWTTTDRHANHGAGVGAGRDSEGIGNIAKQGFVDGGAGRGTHRR